MITTRFIIVQLNEKNDSYTIYEIYRTDRQTAVNIHQAGQRINTKQRQRKAPLSIYQNRRDFNGKIFKIALSKVRQI